MNPIQFVCKTTLLSLCGGCGAGGCDSGLASCLEPSVREEIHCHPYTYWRHQRKLGSQLTFRHYIYGTHNSAHRHVLYAHICTPSLGCLVGSNQINSGRQQIQRLTGFTAHYRNGMKLTWKQIWVHLRLLKCLYVGERASVRACICICKPMCICA